MKHLVELWFDAIEELCKLFNCKVGDLFEYVIEAELDNF